MVHVPGFIDGLVLVASQWIYQNQAIVLKTLWFITAPFNNMRTLKFKAQPINGFFATVNQMFRGSSRLPITAERAVINSLCTVQTTERCSAVVVIWEEPPNIWLTAAKNEFVGRPLNFRVRMLLKSAVVMIDQTINALNHDCIWINDLLSISTLYDHIIIPRKFTTECKEEQKYRTRIKRDWKLRRPTGDMLQF